MYYSEFLEGTPTLLQGIQMEGKTCRQDYGLAVFKKWGTHCVYCERFLKEPYESWLHISVDHVVPKSMPWYADRRIWIEDLANIVTCCRACNEFLNKFLKQYKEFRSLPCPDSTNEFFDICGRVFQAKREHVRHRHELERQFYMAWLDDYEEE